MKKNMVLKYNIVAIEIKLFTRASSRGSSEQKIIGAKKLYFLKNIYIFFYYFYFLSLKSKDECKKNMISKFLDSTRIWQR